MATFHPQYVVDEKQQPQAVILPLAEWERIVDDLDELDDLRAYDEAKAGPQDAVAFGEAVRELEQRHGP